MRNLKCEAKNHFLVKNIFLLLQRKTNLKIFSNYALQIPQCWSAPHSYCFDLVWWFFAFHTEYFLMPVQKSLCNLGMHKVYEILFWQSFRLGIELDEFLKVPVKGTVLGKNMLGQWEYFILILIFKIFCALLSCAI